MKILIVSLGNICSSPFAEAILKFKIEQKKLNAQVDSAGFESFNINEPPSKQITEFAKSKGLDLTNLRCRLFVSEDFDKYDKIYVVDSASFRDIQFFSRNETDMEKVQYLLSVIDGKSRTLPKLFLEGEKGLEEMYSILDNACDIIAEQIN
jgi:protein-tyrosine phosphatase